MSTTSTTTTHAHFPALAAKQTALGDSAQAVLDNARRTDVLALLNEIEAGMDPLSDHAQPSDWVLSKAEDAKWRIHAFTEALVHMSLALIAWNEEFDAIPLDTNDIAACMEWEQATEFPTPFIEARTLGETLYASYLRICQQVSAITGEPVDA
ncbi:hypothetical protein MJ547_04375, partial [Burkholderia gladioli]